MGGGDGDANHPPKAPPPDTQETAADTGARDDTICDRQYVVVPELPALKQPHKCLRDDAAIRVLLTELVAKRPATRCSRCIFCGSVWILDDLSGAGPSCVSHSEPIPKMYCTHCIAITIDVAVMTPGAILGAMDWDKRADFLANTIPVLPFPLPLTLQIPVPEHVPEPIAAPAPDTSAPPAPPPSPPPPPPPPPPAPATSNTPVHLNPTTENTVVTLMIYVYIVVGFCLIVSAPNHCRPNRRTTFHLPLKVVAPLLPLTDCILDLEFHVDKDTLTPTLNGTAWINIPRKYHRGTRTKLPADSLVDGYWAILAEVQTMRGCMIPLPCYLNSSSGTVVVPDLGLRHLPPDKVCRPYDFDNVKIPLECSAHKNLFFAFTSLCGVGFFSFVCWKLWSWGEDVIGPRAKETKEEEEEEDGKDKEGEKKKKTE